MQSIRDLVFRRIPTRTINLSKTYSSVSSRRPPPQLPIGLRALSNTPPKAKAQEEQDGSEASEELKHHKRKRSKTAVERASEEARRNKLKAKLNVVNAEDTKKVTAYCAAERYKLHDVSRLVKAEGFEQDPYSTGLSSQVIHIQVANVMESKEAGDLFIFPSGTVVAWNVPDKITYRLVSKTLVPAALGSRLPEVETEDLEYLEDYTRNNSDVVGDTIVLGTAVSQGNGSGHTNNGDGQAVTEHDVDMILAKLSFSSGLARSTKLAVLESMLSNYFKSTSLIPTVLSQGSRLNYTRQFILMKTGELLNIRAQLNLSSELTDSLPDMFWDSRHELGLEHNYDKVGRALDVNVRIRSLNEKLTYAQEIAQVLSNRLEEKHGHNLEWIIIWLIAFEIMLELHRLWVERNENIDPESTENMLKSYLKQQLTSPSPSV
ncbi:uncharacterized protein K452DRAFT_316430 [Aplosporella prunicola CBS 121167]|uniref:DUF155 domain-containing protein n=1 Tax=Aplosporella prunicola CBS 121167 TaxID=1176127 RepID=A0A6A6BM02_9PEZI|nr:uncharacterized protein K452DRAFT_316430 [Aplosporella prunicola CBS 121167]KAF2144433.1 hypothetical protein K452DRAFT_316430 [Aplosporella prunicola CBS 121167]